MRKDIRNQVTIWFNSNWNFQLIKFSFLFSVLVHFWAFPPVFNIRGQSERVRRGWSWGRGKWGYGAKSLGAEVLVSRVSQVELLNRTDKNLCRLRCTDAGLLSRNWLAFRVGGIRRTFGLRMGFLGSLGTYLLPPCGQNSPGANRGSPMCTLKLTSFS